MITQCYVCKKYWLKDSWIEEWKIIPFSNIAKEIEKDNITHGLCPECTLSEMQRIEKELNELKKEK